MANVNFEHGGNIYGVKNKGLIDFSASINPLGLPKTVRQGLRSGLDRILHYPDPRAVSIKKKIASYLGINPDNILLGNGSAELIYLLASTYRPRTALIAVPTFSEYERALRSVGCAISFLNLREKSGFKLEARPSKKSEMSFLCNPQ